MQIKTISYKRTRNLGNYNNETLELFAELEEGDNAQEKIQELKLESEKGLGIVKQQLKKVEILDDKPF